VSPPSQREDGKSSTSSAGRFIWTVSAGVGAVVGLVGGVDTEDVGLGLALLVAVTFMLAFTLYGAYFLYHSITGSVRFSVQSAVVLVRKRGLDDAGPRAQAILDARSLLVDFPVEFAADAPWARAVLRRRVRVPLMWFTGVAIFFSLFAAFLGFGAWVAGREAALPPGLFGEIFAALLMVAALGFLLLRRFPKVDLTQVAFAAIGAAAAGELADSTQERRPEPLALPDSGRIAFRADPGTTDGLQLRVTLWPAAVDIALVRRDTLEEEKKDVDLGDKLFDRSTIFTVRDRQGLVVEAWLTAEIRTVLLALLARGARVDDGDLVMVVPMASDFDALHELIPLVGGLDVLIGEQRALAQRDRVIQALAGSTEPGRVMLLRTLAQVGRAVADGIRSEWATTGDGPSRVMAAMALDAHDVTPTLNQIAGHGDATSRTRGLALGQLTTVGDGGRACVAQRLAELAARGLADDVYVVLELANEYRRLVELDHANIYEIVPEEMALDGVIGAALGHLLAVKGLYAADAPLDRIGRALSSPIQSLSAESPQALPLWQAYASTLMAFLGEADLPPPMDHVVGSSYARAKATVEALVASQRGGLSVAAMGEEGGLALAKSDASAEPEDPPA
jgi:hypothetical protein